MAAPLTGHKGALYPCRQCGFGVTSDDEYCPDCAIRLVAPEPVRSPPPPAPPAPPVTRRTTLLDRFLGRAAAPPPTAPVAAKVAAALVRPTPPPTAPTGLRDQERQAREQLHRISTEVKRLHTRRDEIVTRVWQARQAGRPTEALDASLAGLDTALEQRQRLAARYRDVIRGIELDRADNSLRLLLADWSRRTGQEWRRALLGRPAPKRTATLRTLTAALCVAISPDGRWLAAGCEDGQVCIWDLNRPRDAVGLRLGSPVVALEWLADGVTLWSCAIRGEVATCTAPSFDAIERCGAPSADRYRVAPTPDGQQVLVATSDGCVRRWDLAQRQEVERWICDGQATSLALDPTGQSVAVGGKDGWLRGARLGTSWEPEPVAGHTGRITCLDYSADGRWLATGGGDTRVRLWDVRGPYPTAELAGHQDAVRCVALNGDGRWVLSGDDRGVVSLWSASGRQPVAQLNAHTGAVAAVAFTPEPGGFVSAGMDRAVLVWSDREPAPILADLVALARQHAQRAAAAQTDAAFDQSPDAAATRRRAADFPGALAAAAGHLVSRAWQVVGRAVVHGGSERDALLTASSRLLDDLKAFVATLPATTGAAATSASPALLAERLVRPVVQDLYNEVAGLGDGLAELTPADCRDRLRRAAQATGRVRQVTEWLRDLPEAWRNGDSTVALVAALETASEHLLELEDLLAARQAAGELAGVQPITDSAPLSRLRLDREALEPLLAGPTAEAELAVEELLSAPDDRPEQAPSTRVAEREQVLRSIREEYHRLAAEGEAAAEVDDL